MAQKIRDDKIGALSHSAGNILMAASVASPAYLTIGGQQYKVTSQLSVALPTLAANTRYQVFAVQSAGVVSLVISTNENSTGPTGQISWKLVGSLYSNSSSAFGAFVDIESKPETLTALIYSPTITHSSGGATNFTSTATWERLGRKMKVRGQITFSNASAAFTHIVASMPTNLLIDTGALLSAVSDTPTIGQTRGHNIGISGFLGDVAYVTTSTVRLLKTSTVAVANPANVETSAISSNDPFAWNVGDTISWFFEVDITGWTNTPIEDL